MKIDSPATLKAARQALGLSCAELAAELRLQGANAGDAVRDMEAGKRTISGPIAVAIELLLRIQRADARLEALFERLGRRGDSAVTAAMVLEAQVALHGNAASSS